MFSENALYSQNKLINKESLEEERKKLEEEVKLTRQLLNETRKIRKQSNAELQLVKSEIRVREKIVNTLGNQVKNIDYEIYTIQQIVQSMQKDIQKLKEEYLEFAYQTYKSHSAINVLLWLLSSESFTQAYNRLRYFKDFSELRQNQIQLIRRAQVRLMEKMQELEIRKNKKNLILNDQKSEFEKLNEAKKEKSKIAENLRKQENYYHKQLNIQNQSMQKIQFAIENLIREETKSKQNASAEAEESDLTAPLSKLFQKNKGKLPWPISMNKAVITGKFGVSEDEVSGGRIKNNGIYMSTSANENVRAVFGGKVTSIQTLPIVGKVVIVQHGNYRTVYANLAEVFVKTGEEIEAFANIGTVKANDQNSQLHFLIYEGKTPLDPEDWIIQKK